MLKIAYVSVCVCRGCQERQREVSSREIRGEAGKSKLTHGAVTFTKYIELAGERERERERTTDRKTEKQTTSCRLQTRRLTIQLRYY